MFAKFFIRTLVGGVAILLSLFCTGGSGAVNGLMLMIICTGGLALIVIAPVAYLLGLILTIAFIPFGSKEGKNKPASSSRVALRTFIDQALAAGKTRDEVYARCLEAGWPKEVLDEEMSK